MITTRKASDRGHFDHGWLDTYHSFSFAGYFDPSHMGFRVLRVINEDRVAPGEGFDTHPHNDMEIITLVLEGALRHQDSMGNGSVIRPGEVQRMSAGTGVTHSEFNASETEPVHLYQIWILPERKGLPPSYEQKAFPPDPTAGGLQLVASRDGREGSVTIHQDASLYLAKLEKGESVKHPLAPGRHAWVQVATGAVEVNGLDLRSGDGLAVSGEESLHLSASPAGELLLFDLP
ncbi:MAG: pirin family protein [Acidobacteriota bacterium]